MISITDHRKVSLQISKDCSVSWDSEKPDEVFLFGCANGCVMLNVSDLADLVSGITDLNESITKYKAGVK